MRDIFVKLQLTNALLFDVGDGWLFTEDTLGTETSSGNDVTYKQQLGSYAE